MAGGVGCLETISIADCNINITPRKDGTHNGNLNSSAHGSERGSIRRQYAHRVEHGLHGCTHFLPHLTYSVLSGGAPKHQDGFPMYIR